VEPHEAALRGYLRRRVTSAADVDDVVQESYLKLLRSPPASGIRCIKAYLFAIARNTSSKLFRKRRIFSPVPVEDLPPSRLWDTGPDAAACAHRRLQDELIAEAIAELPGRCREILLLYIADGLTPTKIAQRLGLSESTVRTQLGRAADRCGRFLRERGVTSAE
jgi:RNA polymerase sigma-70 factor (ECF subfamily)